MRLTAEQVLAERLDALTAERFGEPERLELERTPTPVQRARRAVLIAATKETP